MISIRHATVADAGNIRNIAYNTWPGAYGEILSPSQLQYMLEKMYAMEELEQQLSGNYTYLIAENDTQDAIGFAAIAPHEKDETAFHLYKLYILPQFQKHHCGKILLEQIIRDAKEMKGQRLTLNVNRYNQARLFYEKMGFKIIREEDNDIGSGYFMNDFVMELNID